MDEVVDLGAVAQRRQQNLVTEFGQHAVAMLPPDQKNYDGTLLSSAEGYVFFFQYVAGQLAGALVMNHQDALSLAGAIMQLPPSGEATVGEQDD